MPTLSVGIAIGHFMEPLEDLLAFAKAAEYRAKNPTKEDVPLPPSLRNGLALAIHPRGGAAFTVRDNWSGVDSPGFQPLDRRLLEWAELHQEKVLPTKAAYDLHLASRFYTNWKSNTDADKEALRRAIRSNCLRYSRGRRFRR